MYLLGLTFLVPMMAPRMYLTLSLRGLGFDVFQTNLLTIPSQVLGSKCLSAFHGTSFIFLFPLTPLTVASMLLFVWLAERYKQILAWASLAQIWALPFLIWLRVGYDLESSKWTTWALLTILVAMPMCMS